MITSVRNTSTNPLFSKTPTDPPVGPAEPTTKPTLATTSQSMGRDDFLKLLVSQLKNQDPLNPMDGKDMAAQLAQFSSVEQLVNLNSAFTEQKEVQTQLVDAIAALGEGQQVQADNLQAMIEGQTAMATVGKTAVTTGNEVYIDRSGSGTALIDTGTVKGPGTITVTNANGVKSTATIDALGGQQAFALEDLTFTPPLTNGKNSYAVEVTPTGGTTQAVKTYTTGRITGMRYDNGNPILIIGDSLSIPMSQLTQIRS